MPSDDYGQGWTQLTENGKIFLSKKEKNVFILEGTKAAGFSASVYTGAAEQRDLVDNGSFTLTTELKCMPGEQCPDQHVYLLVDCRSMSDLSSGCDFCGIHLSFDTRELRVESHRRNATKQTLFAQPNCALLRPQSYVTLSVTVVDDIVSLTLSGVSLISGLPCGRSARQVGNSGGGHVGIAVYGKSRCYIRRFRIAPAEAAPMSSPTAKGYGDSSMQLATVGSAVATSRGNSIGVGGAAGSRRGNQSSSSPNITGQTNGSGGGSAFSGEEMELAALIEQDIVVGDLQVRFEDIGGLQNAKRALNEAVVLPLLMPEFFTGIRKPWKGVLLFGPPGTGKTMLAKAVASCTENVTFFNCSSATLTSKWRGESEKLLRSLFHTARAKVPSILFFDEIDSLLSQRGSSAEHEASRRFKSEFLIHMDGLLSDAPAESGQQGHLFVLATSNAPWDLDEALRRRLEKRIYIPLPDSDAREHMFRHHLQSICVGESVDMAELAARTANYSGADIQLICRDASMNPMRRLIDGLSPVELISLRDEGKLSPGSVPVEMDDFQSALQGIQPSVSLSDCQRFLDWSKEFGSK
eukprot:TRINITY_DN30420_c0_g1_i1.p1 TRINITY_DN30420_c0_g1~~TRINITY_DN30420_c0_g1_i1.p1  ORF type:complete len:580 (-),score=102.05 TRINITY_DN30420_c0_g1_i1:182-1921(-)